MAKACESVSVDVCGGGGHTPAPHSCTLATCASYSAAHQGHATQVDISALVFDVLNPLLSSLHNWSRMQLYYIFGPVRI